MIDNIISDHIERVLLYQGSLQLGFDRVTLWQLLSSGLYDQIDKVQISLLQIY